MLQTSFTKKFWLLNILQMLEKMAYWNVLIQLPIYIAQKDVPGGLHWEQFTKGVIFFWWALVQNFSPLFFGYLSDKYNDKKVFNLSFIIIILSYLMLSVSTDIIPFIISVIMLGLGSAMFKPTIQGTIAKELNESNQSRGWGIYFMLINLSVFLAPPLSKYLKEISWQYVFIGSAVITFLNFAINFFLNKKTNSLDIEDANATKHTLYNVFENLFKTQILIFVLSMSGFAVIYMQFYETLPNFIYDWTNTTAIATYLPDFMLMKTSLGNMISYEWLYNINAFLVLFFVVYISVFSSRINILKALMLGTIISALGLVISGISTYGFFTIIGIVVYTIGEMITNPKFTQYLSEQSKHENKSMYLSYLNISFGIGLTFGSVSGSWLYETYAEKSELASRYLWDKFQIINLDPKLALSKLKEVTGQSDMELIDVLFNNYDPYLIWLPFLILASVSVLGLYYVNKNNSK